MTNLNIFNTKGKATNTTNHIGRPAYALSARGALAQLAATGTFSDTYYTSGVAQLDEVLTLCHQVSPEFIAKTAVYARTSGYMKDMPALLCVYLAAHAPEWLEPTFHATIDNAKMLRTFVQMLRSGITGRRSLGSLPKRLVRQWIGDRKDETLFRATVGQSPSLADIIKMVHPKPENPSREALFGYMLGRQVNKTALPSLVLQYESFKAGSRKNVPDVPFQMLTSLPLDRKHWSQILRNANWQMTRMNLNTFLRHGVFENVEMVHLAANRLANPQLIRKARVFPYQLLVAAYSVSRDMPGPIKQALVDAMEIAIENVPKLQGSVYVLPDISGSMGSPVTGYREGSTSVVRCVDVAALMAAAFLRKNQNTQILPFEVRVRSMSFSARDSVMKTTQRLSKSFGGGTNCSAPLVHMNRIKAKADLVIYVSDNESWIDDHESYYNSATKTMQEWEVFKRRNPKAKLVCLNILPYTSTQAHERSDILNLGGFSDKTFEIIQAFAQGTLDRDHWVGEIEKIKLLK